MQLNVCPDVYDKFCKSKSIFSTKCLSDSEFLSVLLEHIESCNSIWPSVVKSENSNGVQVHICPECDFTACSQDELFSHFDSGHNDNGSFSCTCGCINSKLPDFLRHYILCPVAATDLLEPSRGRKRRKMSPTSSVKVSSDDVADENEAKQELYYSYRHPCVPHVPGPSKDKPYGCPKCSKGFKSKSLLDQHMHLHFPPRYKCRWCSNVFRWPPVYYHHKQKCPKRPLPTGIGSIKGSNSDSPTNVRLSSEELVSAQQALSSLMCFNGVAISKSNDASQLNDSSSVNGNLTLNPLTCICTEVLPDFSQFCEHVHNCPSVLSASSVFGQISQRAPRSGTGTDTAHPDPNLEVQEESNSSKRVTNGSVHTNRLFKCSICYKNFTSKLSLKQHVDGKHRAEGKYLCRTCGKRYRWGASFYYHRKSCIPTESVPVISNQAPGLLATHSS